MAAAALHQYSCRGLAGPWDLDEEIRRAHSPDRFGIPKAKPSDLHTAGAGSCQLLASALQAPGQLHAGSTAGYLLAPRKHTASARSC